MPPDRPSPHEHARAMAKKVARLFSRNRDYFLENIETFKREDAEWQRQVKDADKTIDEAFQAILDEREAIKAGKATPRLTDKKKRPEPGFEWRDNFHCPGETDEDDAPDGQMVEGWISQEAVRALAIQYEAANDRGLYWPGQNPTPATMVTLLAALHDQCLRNSPTILDPASGRPLTVAQGTDRGLWALYTARLWCIGAVKGNTDRLDALETYLYHVKEHLAEVQAMKPETAPPPAKTPEERARGARGVSLTYGVIDELLELVDSIRRGQLPVDLPPEDQRNQTVWRKCLRSAEREFTRKTQEWARQVQGPPRGSFQWERRKKVSKRVRAAADLERVRAAAEYEYRSSDPKIKKLTQKRERPLPGELARMGQLLEWHRPALKAEWQRHGYAPEGRLALYAMAFSGASFDSPALDHVLQDLLQIRLRLEQEQARGGKALDGDGGTAKSPESISPQARAIAMILEHPDWTNKTIAHVLGLNPKTLSKPTWSQFMAVRKKAKQNLRMRIPHGSKDGKTGDIDATDE